jgi:hypothetical protein
MLRIVLVAAGLWVGGAACTNGSSLASNARGDLTCAPGPGGVGTLGPCCGSVALEVPTGSLDDAGIDLCNGGSAYALCDGIHFSCEYECTVPAGYSVVKSADASQACPESGVAPIDAPSSQRFPFDGGSLTLGACMGHTVALIPAAACPARCPGSLAYAVCTGSSYGDCACNIPPGYTLAVLSDGGVREAATTDARADAGVVDAPFDGGGDARPDTGARASDASNDVGGG